MIYKTEEEIFDGKIIIEKNDNLQFNDKELFKNKIIDNLVDTIVATDSDRIKKLCLWTANQAALNFGVITSSIQGLYEARGRGECGGFTVPAMNIRTLTYDLARAIFRTAAKISAGAFIFEIAKSEIGYTSQRPVEYASIIMLAAIKEGYSGPIFIQGDHFQVKTENFLKNRDKEINQLKDLIIEAVSAGFYNIDIDSSTLVDLSKSNIDDQQKLNYEVCALLTKFIRNLQPQNLDISIGGEIGEVGGKNSTPPEFHAFMKGYKNTIGNLKGLSKLSIQTGTSHGGVVLPDGSIAKAEIDLDTLKNLSGIAVRDYHLAGCVQHGASTLPTEAFHNFPDIGCAEIHLATQFQNLVYEYLPIPLKEKIYAWLHENYSQEKKPGQTDEQFIYKTRKNALGPFKKEIHSMCQDMKKKISKVLEKEFEFLFTQLKINNTDKLIKKYVNPIATDKRREFFLKEEKDLGVLEGAD